MEKSSFFNSVGGDRVYKAEEWAEYFASFIGNGVFPVPSNGLQVEANSSAGVVIRAGRAWINGYFYFNTDDLNVKLNTADGVLNRIDRIVIRWDLTARTISAEVKSSAPSNNPTTPALQRDADAYELCLADVYVRAGSTAVLQSDITDQRYNSGLCGVVKGTVDQIDASMLAKQFNDYAELFKQETKLDFEAWFEEIRGILSEDLAGSLALAIDDINRSKGQPSGIAMLDALGNPIGAMPYNCTHTIHVTGGSAILHFDDANNYKTPGKRITIAPQITAQSVDNLPEANSGQLCVYGFDSDSVYQTYDTFFGSRWIRQYIISTNTWSTWLGGKPKAIVIPGISGATKSGNIGWAYKNPFGEVSLGIWADLTAPVNSIDYRTIGMLPVGYRPSPYESLQSVVQLRGSESGLEAGFLSVGSSGKIEVAHALGSTANGLNMVRGQINFYAS